MFGERWAPVAGYEGFYEVSSFGRVRGLARRVNASGGRTRLAQARIMTPVFNPDTRYTQCTLWRDGAGKTFAVHRLVTEAFLGPAPEGCEVAHGDGDRRNPRLDNLSWTTHAENLSHMVVHGTKAEGERNGRAKLTGAQVVDIRARFRAGEHYKALAAEFGIKWRTVYAVVNRENWKSVAQL